MPWWLPSSHPSLSLLQPYCSIALGSPLSPVTVSPFTSFAAACSCHILCIPRGCLAPRAAYHLHGSPPIKYVRTDHVVAFTTLPLLMTRANITVPPSERVHVCATRRRACTGACDHAPLCEMPCTTVPSHIRLQQSRCDLFHGIHLGYGLGVSRYSK